MEYDLELTKVVDKIKKSKAKVVCIQLPDGLKSRARDIADRIESETGTEVIIWAGSCFGACDTPELKEADLLIQWGHSKWES